MKLKEEAIEILDSVLANKKNKLTKKDREKLIILREKVRNTNSRVGLFRLVIEMAKLAGVGAQILGDT